MGDLDGRTFCITGANTGIGRETAVTLAGRGGRVVLVCRSEDKTRPVLDEIARAGGDAAFVACDLADLASVRAAAAEIVGLDEPIHVLINNAGVAGHRGETAQGFELAFGVNHLGHFLLTTRLLDTLRASGPARIVNVSSQAHTGAKGIDWDAVRRPTKTATAMREYSVSKLANVLFTQELARRLDPAEVTTHALHPGVVASDIWRRIPRPIRSLMTRRMIGTDEGARTSLYCATAPELTAETGGYYDDCARVEPSAVATAELAAELWRRSEAWVAEA